MEFTPNTIYNMDCIEGMALMPDSCVDVSFTSPPRTTEYGTILTNFTMILCKTITNSFCRLLMNF